MVTDAFGFETWLISGVHGSDVSALLFVTTVGHLASDDSTSINSSAVVVAVDADAIDDSRSSASLCIATVVSISMELSDTLRLSSSVSLVYDLYTSSLHGTVCTTVPIGVGVPSLTIVFPELKW